MRGWCSWTHDPGPCPVDDTPHTACTPASVAAQQTGRVLAVATVRRPRVLDQVIAPTPVAHPDDTFTTATYQRKRHGREAVARRAAARRP